MKYRIPKEWSDLKIKQFIELRAALEMRDVDQLDRNVYIVSALLGKDIESVEANLSLSELHSVIAKTTFTKELPTKKPASKFVLAGKLWRVDLEMKDILPAQYIDLSLLTKTEEDIIENMHEIMAVFCRPYFKKKYDSKKAKEYAGIFYHEMPCDFAYASALFFYHLYKVLLAGTQTYLLEEAEKLTKEVISQSQSA